MLLRAMWPLNVSLTLLRPFWLAMGGLLLCHLFVGPFQHLALFYDEAYYHVWSLRPDWGYYSKPPLVAWCIWLTTQLFGHAEWAVRLASPILYFATAIVIRQIGGRLYQQRTGDIAALLFFTSPLVGFNSLFITTDAPLLFFWALTTYWFIRAIQHNTLRHWLFMGMCLGFGMLSKYTMIVLPLGLLSFLWLSPRYRPCFRSPGVWSGLVLSGLIFLPNLIWNASHDFISFQHTAEISKLNQSLFHPGKLLEFIGAQFLVCGPVCFGFFVRGINSNKGWAERLLLLSALPMLGIISMQALLSHANANWAAPALIPISLLVARYLMLLNKQRAIRWAIGLNIGVVGIFYLYPQLQAALGAEPTRHNTPYHRVSGWRELIQQLPPLTPEQAYISDSRAVLSYLHFYAKSDGDEAFAPVFSFHPQTHIEDHFQLAYPFTQAPFDDFIFASEVPVDLHGCFAQVRALGSWEYSLYPSLTRTLYLYRVRGFSDYEHCMD